MREKHVFAEPTLEVTEFSVEDVITTSGEPGSTEGIELPDHEW